MTRKLQPKLPDYIL